MVAALACAHAAQADGSRSGAWWQGAPREERLGYLAGHLDCAVADAGHPFAELHRCLHCELDGYVRRHGSDILEREPQRGRMDTVWQSISQQQAVERSGSGSTAIQLTQVDVIYDRKTGQLTIRDRDSGVTTAGKFESGGKPWGDPIEPGQYEILEQARNPDSWRLDPIDSKLRNDTHDATGRTHFRLQGPGNTIGCVAACHSSDWWPVKSILNHTSTTKVPDNATPWWRFWSSESVKKYGTMEVR